MSASDRDDNIGSVIILVLLAVVAWNYFNGGPSPSPSENTRDDSVLLSRDEALTSHWDEIREHVTSTEEIEACSLEAGNCYSLEADILGGTIDTLHFTNGGYLQFGAQIDENGNADDVDQEGRPWEFTLDMNSAIVDDAIQEWARVSGYKIE